MANVLSRITRSRRGVWWDKDVYWALSI